MPVWRRPTHRCENMTNKFSSPRQTQRSLTSDYRINTIGCDSREDGMGRQGLNLDFVTLIEAGIRALSIAGHDIQRPPPNAWASIRLRAMIVCWIWVVPS